MATPPLPMRNPPVDDTSPGSQEEGPSPQSRARGIHRSIRGRAHTRQAWPTGKVEVALPPRIAKEPKVTMKSTKLLFCSTVAVTAILALSGCVGNSSDPASSSSPSGTSSETTAPAGTNSAAEASSTANAVTAKTYPAEELSATIPMVVDSTGTPYTRIPSEVLEQSMAGLKQQMESIQVSPTECQELALQNSQIPEGSILAGGNSIADKSVITVISAQNPAVLARNKAQVDAGVKNCSNFTITANGQEIKAAVTPIEAKTSAPESSASLVVQTMPTGSTLSVLAVTGLKDNVMVTAAATGVVLQASDSADLVRIVDEYFAKLSS